MPAFLPVIFFVIALLYASVGFGGGSSYIAFLTFYDLDYALIPIIALSCNLVVVSGGTWVFYRQGYLDWKRITPLVFCSVPAAYFGGRLPIPKESFLLLLGTVLMLASVLLLIRPAQSESQKSEDSWKKSPFLSALIGLLLGVVSGMVGIGGGIFLSPLLHLLHWGKARMIAGTASFFILVNSFSGLAGQLMKRQFPDFTSHHWFLLLPLIVLFGGQLGSRLSAQFFSPIILRRMTALLVFIAGSRVLWMVSP